MASETVTIAARFNGPPASGNGGYVCGLLARDVEGATEATLRMPPPLETSLSLESDGATAKLTAPDGALVCEARAVRFDLQPPPAPSLAQAKEASTRYRGFGNVTYPTCFVCGHGRPLHDGLELFTGPVEGRDMVACVWTPSTDLADDHGIVREEFVHAALDCPSYWALPRSGEMRALLARLTSSIDAPLPRTGEPLIVAAWPLGSDGRKHRGATALYHSDGRVIARAEALWIEPKT